MINRKGPIDKTSDFNFNILKIEKNARDVNIKGQVNMPTIQFQSGDNLRYHLQIAKYLNQQTRESQNIPSGHYYMDLLVSIVEADGGESSPQSRTLKVEDVSVSLN